MPIPNHIPTAGRAKWYSHFSRVVRGLDRSYGRDLNVLQFAAAFVIGYGV